MPHKGQTIDGGCRSPAGEAEIVRDLPRPTVSFRAVVAGAASLCAAYLVFARTGVGPQIGWAIVATSVIGVAALRTHERTTTRGASRQRAVKLLALAGEFCWSVGVAVLIVGLADIAFVLGYGLMVGGPRFFLWTDHVRAQELCPSGIIFGCLAALVVSGSGRWAFWSRRRFRERVFRGLAPVCIVFVLWGANFILEWRVCALAGYRTDSIPRSYSRDAVL